MLIVFGGLPGTGKSTIATLLARRLRATYLRIDTIEQALRLCGTLPAGVLTEGYAIAYRVAEENLRVGSTVVADSVNPLPVTRNAWRGVSHAAGVPVLEVEIICSNADDHRRRVEVRSSDIPGLRLPTWNDVQARDYQPWDRPRTVMDTFSRTPEDVLQALLSMPQLTALSQHQR